MTNQTASEGWVTRIGASSAIAGAVLAGIGNLFHPATPTGDAEGVARTIADSDIWTADHLVIVVGLILMLFGLLAIADSIQGGLAGALARFGSFAAVAGIAVGLILVILDGAAAKHIAEAWAVAPPEQEGAALRVLVAEENINFALAALFNILFAGVTFILYGLAAASSGHYPRGLAWVVVVAGIGSIVVGIVQAYVGESTGVTRIATIIFPTVITLWVALMGVLLLRKASSAT